MEAKRSVLTKHCKCYGNCWGF